MGDGLVARARGGAATSTPLRERARPAPRVQTRALIARVPLWVLPALGGALAALAWLPTGGAPAFPLAFAIAALGLMRAETGRQAVWVGAVFGAARYAVAAHFLWALLVYSKLAIIFYVLAIAFIVPFGIVEAWGAYRLERWTGVPRTVYFALLYALLGWVRTLGDLSFPADLLAHGLGARPEWLAPTRWLGPYAITFLMVGLGGMLAHAWLARQERPKRALALAGCALLLWLVPPALSLLPSPAPTGTPAELRVGIVQPYAHVEEKLDREAWPDLWHRLESLSARVARDADLIVWPEAARPGGLIRRPNRDFFDEQVGALAAKLERPILYGTDLVTAEPLPGGRARLRGIYNGAALALPSGSTASWYGKQRLLPFAEAFPFAGLFGYEPAGRREGSFLTLLGNYSPGPEATIFEVGEARIGVLICYEGMYPHLAREYRNRGANVLAVLTNDAWWGKSVFPSFHAKLAAARANELDLPVFRAANSGVSSVLDGKGRQLAATKTAEITTLSVPLELAASPPTLYARTGDVFVALMVVFPFAARLLRRK